MNFLRDFTVAICLIAVTSCATRTGGPRKSPQSRVADATLPETIAELKRILKLHLNTEKS